MIVLTSSQARDLRYLVALYRLTVSAGGVARSPLGDSVQTGSALARKGLVCHAARQFSNRVATWQPTGAGLAYVEKNFVVFDDFAAAAVLRAVDALRGPLR